MRLRLEREESDGEEGERVRVWVCVRWKIEEDGIVIYLYALFYYKKMRVYI